MHDKTTTYTMRINKKKLGHIQSLSLLFGISKNEMINVLLDYYLAHNYERLPKDLAKQKFTTIQIERLKDQIHELEKIFENQTNSFDEHMRKTNPDYSDTDEQLPHNY